MFQNFLICFAEKRGDGAWQHRRAWMKNVIYNFALYAISTSKCCMFNQSVISILYYASRRCLTHEKSTFPERDVSTAHINFPGVPPVKTPDSCNVCFTKPHRQGSSACERYSHLDPSNSLISNIAFVTAMTSLLTDRANILSTTNVVKCATKHRQLQFDQYMTCSIFSWSN